MPHNNFVAPFVHEVLHFVPRKCTENEFYKVDSGSLSGDKGASKSLILE